MNHPPNLNVGSSARLLLGIAAGYLAAKGVLTADQAASFADTIFNAYTSIAAVVAIGAGVWAWWKNLQHKKVAVAASEAGVPVEQVKQATVVQAAAIGRAVAQGTKP